MADLGSTQAVETNVAEGGGNLDSGDIATTVDPGAITIPVIARKYVMMGADALTDGLYATWTVVGATDYAGTYAPEGFNMPLRNIAVIARWSP